MIRMRKEAGGSPDHDRRLRERHSRARDYASAPTASASAVLPALFPSLICADCTCEDAQCDRRHSHANKMREAKRRKEEEERGKTESDV